MNLLRKTRVYLVGAMSNVNGEPWRSHVEVKLKDLGIIVLNPYNHPFVNCTREGSDVSEGLRELLELKKYDEVAAIAKKVRAEDLRCVDICDFIFCHS